MVRQFWILSALLLDAFGAAAQSLIGYFLGAGKRDHARHAAGVACSWGLGAGIALTAIMALAEEGVAAGFVPASAQLVFGGAWWACALAQPVNALAFATDGIHWGSGDYRFLRNAMLASTGTGLVALAAITVTGAGGLTAIWVVTGGWIAIRSGFGLIRIWPGWGGGPLTPDPIEARKIRSFQ